MWKVAVPADAGVTCENVGKWRRGSWKLHNSVIIAFASTWYAKRAVCSKETQEEQPLRRGDFVGEHDWKGLMTTLGDPSDNR